MTSRIVLAILSYTLAGYAGPIWSDWFSGASYGEPFAVQHVMTQAKILSEPFDYPPRRKPAALQLSQTSPLPAPSKKLKTLESQEYEQRVSGNEPTRDVLFFLAGLLVGILGIIVTLWTYRKTKRERRPGYMVKSLPIVKPGVFSWQDLRLKANDVPIGKLTLSKVAFWNGGKEPIEAGDVLEPIVVKPSHGNRFIQWTLLHEGDLSSNVSIQEHESDGRELEIRFDILDQDEGVVLLIAHTGQQNEDIEVSGKIKTVRKLWRIDVPDADMRLRDQVRKPYYLLAYLAGFSWLVAFFAFTLLYEDSLRFFLATFWLGLAWFILVGIAGFIGASFLGLFVGLRLSLPISRIPPQIRTVFKAKF